MSTEQNKNLAKRFFEAINERDLAALGEIAAPDVAQGVSERLIPSLYGSYSDHHIEVTDMMAEGDRVWVRFTTSGTHSGEWRGIPPTGKRFSNPTPVGFLRIADGKVAAFDVVNNPLTVAEQLGASLAPPARGEG
jgi:C-1 hydroxylase